MDARRSMLDVVTEGLQATNRTTYIHRLFYIGEHKMGSGPALEDFFKDLLARQAEEHSHETWSGFLLYYQAHFLHVCAGSESAITKHLRFLTDPKLKEASLLGRMKVVVEVTHIKTRFFSSWSARSAVPPTLAQRVGPGTPMAEVARLADGLVTKFFKLCDALKKLPAGSPLGQSLILLPEAEIVDFLLRAPQLQDVRELVHNHDRPPPISLYDDVVWPAQNDYVPYDVYSKGKEDGPEAEQEMPEALAA